MFGLLPTMVQAESVIHALRPDIWYSANYISSISGTTAVQQIFDRSGGLFDSGVESNPAIRPFMSESAGGNVLCFAAGDLLTVISGTVTAPVLSVVVTAPNPGTTQTVAFSFGASDEAGYFEVFRSHGGSAARWAEQHRTNSLAYKISDIDVRQMSTFVVILDPSEPPPTDIVGFVDGADMGNAASAGNPTSTWADINNLWIGTDWLGNNALSTGFADIMIFFRKLETNEVLAVEQAQVLKRGQT